MRRPNPSSSQGSVGTKDQYTVFFCFVSRSCFVHHYNILWFRVPWINTAIRQMNVGASPQIQKDIGGKFCVQPQADGGIARWQIFMTGIVPKEWHNAWSWIFFAFTPTSWLNWSPCKAVQAPRSPPKFRVIKFQPQFNCLSHRSNYSHRFNSWHGGGFIL